MSEIKLDLGAGKNKRVGFTGVDIAPVSDIQFDLMTFPWPWENNSVDEVYSSHFVEHLPMAFINGKDLFFAFFDEIYRILKPDRLATIIVPCGRSNRAFQDPTHRRFLMSETFLYLDKNWRKANGLDHYTVDCHFEIAVDPLVMQPELQLMHPEAAMRRLNGEWNVVADWQARLIKRA